MSMKYYIGELRIRDGDHEYTSNFRFQTASKPDVYLKKAAKAYYEGKPEKWEEGYLHENGEVYIAPSSHQEITKKVYDIINSIPEL